MNMIDINSRTLKRASYAIAGLLIVLITMCTSSIVHADAAPPSGAPGSSIGTGEFETHVQMVSEEVIIEVTEYHGPTVILYEDEELIENEPFIFPNAQLVDGDIVGHVTATFLMQNRGDEFESFDVWFPIGASDGYFNITTIANFQAWVNGQPVETDRTRTTDRFDNSIPWATWPSEFPVGQPVELRVEYDFPPNYYSNLLHFNYVLETGAGWWDVIGSGKFIFKLPYEVSEENFEIYSRNQGRFPMESLTISGNEMVWTFTDLEPDDGDNIHLNILYPSIWGEIVVARTNVETNPESAQANYNLARTLVNAMGVKHGISSGRQFIPEAMQAFQTALEIEPDNVEINVDYVDFLLLQSEPIGPLHDDLKPALERALALDPDNERLLDINSRVRQMEAYIKEQAMTATASVPTTTPSPTATRQPTATTVPTTLPTITPTIESEIIRTQQQTGEFPVLPFVIGLGIMLTITLYIVRQRD